MSEEFIQVPLEVELDALCGSYVTGQLAPGLVYGVTSSEGLVHARGFGIASDGGELPDTETVFPIASMSKSFMACAALIARDRGLISLTDPITRYVPEFRVRPGGIASDEVPTLEMLFSMCGGLTEDNAWVDPFVGMPTATLLGRVERGVRLSRTPGTAYEYSNLGYTLACLAVSRAVDRPLTEFVRDEVLAPLGLNSTHFDSQVPPGAHRAVGYSLDSGGNWKPFPHEQSDAFAGAGGLVSTVTDLARWVTWLGAAMRAEDSTSGAVLRAASRRELQRVHILTSPSITADQAGSLGLTIGGYGLGLAIDADLHRGVYVSHAGGLPGFHLHMRWHPASGHGMIVLTNSHRGDPKLLATQALSRILALERAAADSLTLWPETVALQADAERLVRNWDDDLAARIFAENVAFDRALSERRAEIDRLVHAVGPLLERHAPAAIVSAATPAEVSWSIPAEQGELLCMIHLTPVEPAQIQEFVVQAVGRDTPRSAAPIEISSERRTQGNAILTPLLNTSVRMP